MNKLILLDCDGCLTDGGYYVSDTDYSCGRSQILKKFNTKDWHRLNQIVTQWPNSVKIVTATENKCIDQQVERMPNEIQIIRTRNKLDYIDRQFVRTGLYEWSNICYIGDDDIDLPLLEKCGIVACPADAADEVIELINNRDDAYLMTRKGGHGCVREFLDLVLKISGLKVNNYYGPNPTPTF